MRIGFMGTPDFAAIILRALLAAEEDVAFAVTQPDKPKGRKGEPAPSPVKGLAQDYGLPILQPARVRDRDACKEIASYAPELLVVAAFGQILPEELLDLPRFGCVNVHASLLPAYRGASPIQHAILDGVTTSGVTLMQMDAGLDTGDILAQTEVVLAPDETAGSLFDKLSDAGAKLLLANLPAIESGNLMPVKQPEKSTTPYAGMLKKKDGRIDWTKSAVCLERQIRAFHPWPGATCMLDGQGFKILRAVCASSKENIEDVPGAFCVTEDDEMLVQTGTGVLQLLEVQLAGKRALPVADFLRGYHLKEKMLR